MFSNNLLIITIINLLLLFNFVRNDDQQKIQQQEQHQQQQQQQQQLQLQQQQLNSKKNYYVDLIKQQIEIYRNDSFKIYGNNNNVYDENDKCINDINELVNLFEMNSLLPLEFIDAWGKIPSGILSGNIYELGHFDQCIGLKYKIDKVKPIKVQPRSVINNIFNIDNNNIDNANKKGFKGQYCLTELKIDIKFPREHLLYDTRNITTLKYTKNTFNTFMNIRIPNFELNYDSLPQLIWGVGICIPDSCSPQFLSTLIQNFTIENIQFNANVLENGCYRQEQHDVHYRIIDIIALLIFTLIGFLLVFNTIYDIYKQKINNNSDARPMLQIFSMYTNGQKLFSCKQNNISNPMDVIDCLNGIRVLSIIWIVLGHTYSMAWITPIINRNYALEWIKSIWSMTVISGSLGVDSFFLLSGLLVTLGILRELDKRQKINIFLLYIHRYLRLTPVFAATLLFYITYFKYLGSGPLWNPLANATIPQCEKYWWSSLLYIQNYVNPLDMCLPHSWYLNVDWQLYLLAPFLIYPIWRWRLKALWIIPLLVILSTACEFQSYMNENASWQIITQKIDDSTYYKTHTRMRTWLIGILLGYILNNIKYRRVNIPKFILIVGYVMALGTFGSIIFGQYPMQQITHSPDTLESAFYESFSRVAWVLALSWIIFVCVNGYGGPINWFLSLNQWKPLAKLTYCIYILHVPIQFFVLGIVRVPESISDINVIFKFWSVFGAVLAISTIWTLAFESPILALERIIKNRFCPNTEQSGFERLQPQQPLNDDIDEIRYNTNFN